MTNLELAPLYECQTEIAGRRVEVGINFPLMMDDLVTRGRERGLNEGDLQELASLIHLNPNQYAKDGAHATTKFDPNWPARTARIDLEMHVIDDPIYGRAGVRGFPKENFGKPMGKSASDEAVAMNTKNLLEIFWCHEREHLLQVLETGSMKDLIKHQERLNTRVMRIRDKFKKMRMATGVGLPLVAVILNQQGQLNAINIADAVAGAVIIVTGLDVLSARLQRREYRNAWHERRSFYAGENLPVRSDIFTVRVVKDTEQPIIYQ